MLSREDVRINPGTMGLAGSWVLVFLLILLVRWYQPAPLPTEPWWEPLKVSTVTGHRFGDMTWREVRQGQSWRLLTATFIHFGLIHVTLNTLGLINLGRLVEPWYRTGPFLAACLAMGGLGNLLGGALRQLVGVSRPWLASIAAARHWPGAIERALRGGAGFPETVPTGGGSTVLLGLLALGAVVGWRSRTRIGVHLRKQMVLLLVLTAVLGLAMSGLVDNYGHLGGAIIGALIGLFDRQLVRWSKHRGFRAACWAMVMVVSSVCLGLAIRDDRGESDYRHRLEQVFTRGRAAETTRIALDRLHILYASAALRADSLRNPNFDLDSLALNDLLARGPKAASPSKPEPGELARERAEMIQRLDQLDALPADLWGPTIAEDLARVRLLARASIDSAPSYDQVYDFVVSWISAEKGVRADLARLNAQFIELEALRKRSP